MQLFSKLQNLPAQRPEHNKWMKIYQSSGELDENASLHKQGEDQQSR